MSIAGVHVQASACSNVLIVLLATLLGGCAAHATRVATVDREPDEQHEVDPLLAGSGIAHVVVAEAFRTPATPLDNIDSPASWRNAQGQRLLFATAKATGKIIVYDGNTGASLRSFGGIGTGPGQLDRPNGISIIDDLLLVVERDNRRVQVFQLPGFEPLLAFGGDVLRQPYGLWTHPRDGGYDVIVSDNYMAAHDDDVPPPLAQLGERFKRYQLAKTNGAWIATQQASFGDTTHTGAIRIAESVFGDAANDRLLLAEEDVATGTQLREYSLDGRYRGRDVGAGLFKAQAEGMALFQCRDGSGWWLATDQFKDSSLFHVFDRRTLAHVGAFAGKATANTDGVWLDQGKDARFPQGVFYAVDDDQAVSAFDWRDIARALQLPACATT